MKGRGKKFFTTPRHCWGIAALLTLSAVGWALAAEEEAGSEVFDLGEVGVVVIGEKSPADLATTVTEVSQKDIQATSSQTVAEALDFSPGVDIQQGNKGQYSVNIRGFDQGDVKVLIDGVPAHETYFRTLDLSMLPVDAISKIVVTKGASSVLYGSNTMGGVVNIITKKGGLKPYRQLTNSFGDYGTRNYTFNHGATEGNINYWLTYGYRESGGFPLSEDFDPDSPREGEASPFHEDGGKRDLSHYRFHSLNAKVGYEPNENQQLYLSLDYHNNERGVPPEFDRYWAYTQWDQWHLNLVGERKINPSLTLKARTFYVDHEDEIEDVGQGDHQTKKKWFEKSGYDDYSQGGEFQALYNLGKRNELRAGFNFIRDHHRQQDFLDDQSLDVISGKKAVGWQTPETYEADTWSLGLEDEFKPTEKLSYVLGLSYDYFNPRKAFDQPTPGNVSSVNPQAGVVLDLTPKTTLHASVGKKVRFPHLKELYSKLGGGNPDLDPQKALAYEVGAEHRFNPSLRGSMALFYNDIKDLIEQVNVGDNRIYQNIGKARIQGVEMGLEKTLSSHSSLGANYTYLSARDRDNHRELEGRPRHRLNLDFRRQFSAGLDASLQASYTQRQFEYDKNGNPFQRPDFLLLNFRVSKKQDEQWGGKTEYFLEVTNVTDRDYYESKPMPGRNFRIGYSQEW